MLLQDDQDIGEQTQAGVEAARVVEGLVNLDGLPKVDRCFFLLAEVAVDNAQAT